MRVKYENAGHPAVQKFLDGGPYCTAAHEALGLPFDLWLRAATKGVDENKLREALRQEIQKRDQTDA